MFLPLHLSQEHYQKLLGGSFFFMWPKENSAVSFFFFFPIESLYSNQLGLHLGTRDPSVA